MKAGLVHINHTLLHQRPGNKWSVFSGEFNHQKAPRRLIPRVPRVRAGALGISKCFSPQLCSKLCFRDCSSIRNDQSIYLLKQPVSLFSLPIFFSTDLIWTINQSRLKIFTVQFVTRAPPSLPAPAVSRAGSPAFTINPTARARLP